MYCQRLRDSQWKCTNSACVRDLAKDEFKIDPRYAHKKKLKQIREKTYEGSKLTYENNFTIKKPRKNRNYSQCSKMICF